MQKITLRPSWLLAVILVVAHATAAALVLAVNLPPWLKLIAVAALLLSCLFSVRRAALLLAPYSTVAIEVASDNRLSIQTRDGKWMECEVLDSTYVGSFLTVLNLGETGKRARRHVVIMRDNIDSEDFRRLRVWLRWHRGGQAVR